MASHVVFMPLQPIPRPSSCSLGCSRQWPPCCPSQPGSQTAFSAHHSLLLVTTSAKFPGLPEQWCSFQPKATSRKECSCEPLSTYTQAYWGPQSQRGGGTGQCPLHASNSAGPKLNSSGLDHTTTKNFPDCHYVSWSSQRLLTQLMCQPPSWPACLFYFILHTVTVSLLLKNRPDEVIHPTLGGREGERQEAARRPWNFLDLVLSP